MKVVTTKKGMKMTTDIHTKVMLENWGFLAEVGEWETLEKAVNIYLEQNPPQIYPTESNADSFVQTSARLSEPHPQSIKH